MAGQVSYAERIDVLARAQVIAISACKSGNIGPLLEFFNAFIAPRNDEEAAKYREYSPLVSEYLRIRSDLMAELRELTAERKMPPPPVVDARYRRMIKTLNSPGRFDSKLLMAGPIELYTLLQLQELGTSLRLDGNVFVAYDIRKVRDERVERRGDRGERGERGDRGERSERNDRGRRNEYTRNVKSGPQLSASADDSIGNRRAVPAYAISRTAAARAAANPTCWGDDELAEINSPSDSKAINRSMPRPNAVDPDVAIDDEIDLAE